MMKFKLQIGKYIYGFDKDRTDISWGSKFWGGFWVCGIKDTVFVCTLDPLRCIIKIIGYQLRGGSFDDPLFNIWK